MKRIIAIIALAGFFAAQHSVFGEAQDAATRERGRVLVDTNSTTTVTLHTATGAGQLLSGQVDGTNAIWIATAEGTNSWTRIALEGE